MHNKEVKRIVLVQISILVIFIVLNIIFNLAIHNYYKQTLVRNNSYVIASIIDKHPELEEEIISSLIEFQNDNIKSKELLEKYGLDDIDSLEYFNNIQNMRKKINTYSFSFFISSFLIINVIYIIFIKRQYKRINDIHKYLNKVLNGDYSLDIREYDEGDISNLKNDIYKMTVLLKEQNELSLKDKKNLEILLSDISHQIKTPLTSMNVINDLLSEDNIDSKVKQQFLMKNKEQLKRIEWLVSTLLKISRLDSGMVTFKKEKVLVDSLIDNALEPFQIPMELKGQTINIKGDSNIEIEVDYHWTLEAIVNILKNAHEHTPDNGEITIKYDTNPIFTRIMISDTGEGISKQEIKHIFERFYKGKNSSKDSVGIGLNMSKKIIDMQNGDIFVSSKQNKGTTFEIKFYKKNI